MWCESEVLKPAAEPFQVPVKNCSGSAAESPRRRFQELSARLFQAGSLHLLGSHGPAILSPYLLMCSLLYCKLISLQERELRCGQALLLPDRARGSSHPLPTVTPPQSCSL